MITPLFTPVTLPTGLPHITQRHKLMLLGSCFTTEIGERLQDGKFDCCINPYGTLYNPCSITAALREVLQQKTYTGQDLFEARGIWHSRMHHGDYSAVTCGETLERINRSLQKAVEQMENLDVLLLTWGSAYVYRQRQDGCIVGNCHKLPEKEFMRTRLTVDEIVADSQSLIESLLQKRPALKIVITVSPIRHLRDGLHGNQLSKSTLLLAAERLCSIFPASVYYFPAYEIIVDELRDYRFYANDLVHPSEAAVDYVWQCFSQTCLDSQTRAIAGECEKIAKMLKHKPINTKSEEHKRFLGQIVLKINQLNDKYPYLDFQNERNLCCILSKKLHQS